MLYVSIICSSLLLSNISLYGYTTVSLSIHLLVSILTVSSFGILLIKLYGPQCTSLCGHMLHFLLGEYLEVQNLGHMGRGVFNFLENRKTI